MENKRVPGASTLSRTGLTEAELISRAKEFQPEAWDAIYNAYYPKMYTFLYVHLGDRMTAEDLASQVFEEACKAIHRFQYRGVPLSSWLYRIAHNLMVDFLKRRRRLRTHSIDADGAPQLAAADNTETMGLRDQLSRALCRLTREQQQVLLLRHLEGHDITSISRIMGKKENAVRALEFRALRSLRRILGSDRAGSW